MDTKMLVRFKGVEVISDKEIEEAASKSEDGFNCIDTFKGVNNLTVGQIYQRGFWDGAKWAIREIQDKASEGFEEWNDRINSRPYYSRCFECGSLGSKFTWQACAVSKDKEIQRLKHELQLGVELLNSAEVALENKSKEIGRSEHRGNTVDYIYDKLENYSRQLGEVGPKSIALEAENAKLLQIIRDLKELPIAQENISLEAENKELKEKAKWWLELGPADRKSFAHLHEENHALKLKIEEAEKVIRFYVDSSLKDIEQDYTVEDISTVVHLTHLNRKKSCNVRLSQRHIVKWKRARDYLAKQEKK